MKKYPSKVGLKWLICIKKKSNTIFVEYLADTYLIFSMFNNLEYHKANNLCYSKII